MLIISIKYVAIVMRADNNGEGGIMALLALNLRKAKIADNKNLHDCHWFYRCIAVLVTVLLPQPFRYCQPLKACLLPPMCLTHSSCRLRLLLSSLCFSTKTRYGLCR